MVYKSHVFRLLILSGFVTIIELIGLQLYIYKDYKEETSKTQNSCVTTLKVLEPKNPNFQKLFPKPCMVSVHARKQTLYALGEPYYMCEHVH